MTDSRTVDLEGFSLAELKSLEKKVSKAIANFEARKRKEALSELEAKAKEMGFTLSELTGDKIAKFPGKTAGVAKYANPENPNQTWTGKGRRPDWFVAAIDGGKSREDLEI